MDTGLFVAATVSGIFFALLGYSYGWSARLGNRILPFLAVFTAISGLVALVIGLVQGTDWGDARLWALGIAAGIDFVIVILSLMRANALGPASVVWTVVNLALILPVAFSGLFLGEPLYITDLSLIIVFVLMLYAFSKGVEGSGEVEARNRKAFHAYSMTVFLTNGTFMILMKYRDNIFDGGNSAGYGAISFLVTAVLAAIMHFSGKNPDKGITPSEVRAGIVSGVLNGGGFLLQLMALALPAVVMFPLNQGISLLGGVVLTSVLMKERINPQKLAGFVLGALLLTLSVFRTSLADLIR